MHVLRMDTRACGCCFSINNRGNGRGGRAGLMGVWTDTTGATPAQQHSTITQFLETFGKALHQRESDQNFRKSKTQHFRSRFHCRRSPGFETLVRFIFCQREVGWERQRLVWHFPSPSDCSSSHIGTKEGTFSLVPICLTNLG